MDQYDQLLETCDFSKEEARDYMPTLKEGLKKWGVGPDKVNDAVKLYLPTYFDLSIPAMRKMLGVWLKEYIKIPTMPKDKIIVDSILPQTDLSMLYSFKAADPDRVWVGFLDWIAVLVGGGFFRNANYLVETSERFGMDVNAALCPLNKTRYAMYLKNIIPNKTYTLMMNIICDDSPLTEEMIHLTNPDKHYYRHIMRVKDAPKGVWEDEDDLLVEHLGGEVKSAVYDIAEKAGINMKPQHMMAAIDNYRAYAGKVMELAGLMRNDPIPIRGIDFYYLIVPMAMAMDLDYPATRNILDEYIKAGKERVDKGIGVLPKGAPRAIWQTTAPHGENNWEIKMFEDLGVAAYYFDFGIPLPKYFMPPRKSDPFDIVAEMFLKYSLNVEPWARAELMTQCVDQEHLDGILWHQFWYCRHWGTEGQMVKKELEAKGSKVPFVHFDGCWWYARDYGEEKQRTIFETAATMFKDYKAKKTNSA